MEDDVVLADCWQQQLQELINSETEMVLLGWNLDSVLRAKFSNHLEIITLFEPAYPSEDSLQAIVNSRDIRRAKPLHHAFGLPGYWIHPKAAKILLNRVKQLETMTLELGRGFPDIRTLGIDALLNIHYRSINAKVIIPPLALALNDQSTSLTRNKPKIFGH